MNIYIVYNLHFCNRKVVSHLKHLKLSFLLPLLRKVLVAEQEIIPVMGAIKLPLLRT